jgi:hypothetical protein
MPRLTRQRNRCWSQKQALSVLVDILEWEILQILSGGRMQRLSRLMRQSAVWCIKEEEETVE